MTYKHSAKHSTQYIKERRIKNLSPGTHSLLGKHLAQWINKIKAQKVEEMELVNFDVVSLCTKISMDSSIGVKEEVANEGKNNLVRVSLKFVYFSFKWVIFLWIEGIEMR